MFSFVVISEESTNTVIIDAISMAKWGCLCMFLIAKNKLINYPEYLLLFALLLF